MTTMSTNGDPYVLNVQKWVNNTYRGKPGYTEIEENGKTGWTTIYALLHGLQITLEVGSTADNFGQGTETAFNNYIRDNGVIQQQTSEITDTVRKQINGIIQGALLCKGYPIGANTPTEQFLSGTGSAIRSLKEDAGLEDTSTEVTLNIMKALLSMDYFFSYDTSERTQKIITMQRYLNRNYEDYIGITPCDGVYGRRTNKALIIAIQAEEGLSPDDATGNCGDTTKRCLPIIQTNGGYSGINVDNEEYNIDSIANFKTLANLALYFNGIGSGTISSVLEENIIKSFQIKYGIPQTGNLDYTTWLSLLISSGDINRTAIACDCMTKITADNVDVLKNNNYQYIARYLVNAEGGRDKKITLNEVQVLFNNGIRLFPIFQTFGTSVGYFTASQGEDDGITAAQAINDLDLQFGAIIYFAVDCDPTDAEITSNIIPYFTAVQEALINESKGKYRVGVYGTRNVCTRVSDSDLACSSFVSDMSTGFSGNLGFAIPDNWALDQFATITISSNGKSIEIDKDGFSGQYKGISQEYSGPNNNSHDYCILDDGNTVRWLINMGETSIPVYENKTNILPEIGPTTPSQKLDGDIIGYIKPRDFYLRYALESQTYDNIHRVMFNDGTDVKIGYIQEQYKFSMFQNPKSNEAIEYQILPNQDVFTCFHYNPTTGGYDKVDFGSNQEFTINKTVPYFDANGNYKGNLHKGDVIKIFANNTINTGYSRPWCNRVDQIKWKGSTNFEEFDMYVSVGIEYASSGSERAWY